MSWSLAEDTARPLHFRLAIIQRFLPSRSRGGAGYFTHGLANALVARGHDVTVVSADPAPAGARYRVVVLDRTAAYGRLAPFAFPWLVARQAFAGFDLVHAQGDDHLIPRRGTPPVVRTLHGSSLAEALANGIARRSPKVGLMHLVFYASELVATLRADRVVAVARHVGRHYPRVDAVIPNGVDLARFAPDGTPKTSQPTVLFVGELASRKRGTLLVELFRRHVRPRLPDAELWLVSPDRAEGPGVRWWGRVDEATLVRLYRQAWVLCLPSRYEGFGRPYVEAMAAGTPVVATPNPGAREVLDEGRYGCLVREKELGQALTALLTDATRRAELTTRGHARAACYGWDTVAEAYEQVYAGVVRQGARDAAPRRPVRSG